MSKSSIQLIAALSIAAPLSAWAGSGVPNDQLWSELDLEAALGGGWAFMGYGQYRVSETLPNPVSQSLGAWLSYEKGDWTYLLGYKHQLSTHPTDDPTVNQYLSPAVVYAPRFGRSTLAVRLRFDDTLKATSGWRMRIRVEYRWATELGPISYVYTNDEVFYQFSSSAWFQNRFDVGVNMVFTKRTSMRLYYRRQYNKENDPSTLNILGITLVGNF